MTIIVGVLAIVFLVIGVISIYKYMKIKNSLVANINQDINSRE